MTRNQHIASVFLGAILFGFAYIGAGNILTLAQGWSGEGYELTSSFQLLVNAADAIKHRPVPVVLLLIVCSYVAVGFAARISAKKKSEPESTSSCP